MSSTINLLMAQINPTVGALKNNVEKIISIILENQETQDIILFPELALSGYPPEDLLFRLDFHKQIEEYLSLIQKTVKNCHVIVGHPLQKKKNCFNAASIFSNGLLVNQYCKQLLPNYGIFDEKRYFTQGPSHPCILTIKNQRLGILICEDIWQEEPIQQLLYSQVTGCLCINASPFDVEKQALREKLLAHHAKKGVAMFYVNQVGGQDELVFDGQSMAFDAQGNMKARGKAFKEDLVFVNFNNSTMEGHITPQLSWSELVYRALVLATHDYVKKNKFSEVLLGLSGGIDSALTLCIAVDALGASKVQVVRMPSPFTAAMSLEDAEKQAIDLGVNCLIIPIDGLFKSFQDSLDPFFQPLQADITEENLQARIRGMILMALSNKFGKMVLSTSNKSETAVGYTTLYGDMAGGFSPLQDILKTEVYALARYRNQLSPVIPERVLTRPPTAELKINQTDQDTLPAYSILDAIIKSYLEQNASPSELIKQGFSKEDIYKVLHLIKQNEYKRRQSALGPKISTRAFGRDWRLPITSGFNEITE